MGEGVAGTELWLSIALVSSLRLVPQWLDLTSRTVHGPDEGVVGSFYVFELQLSESEPRGDMWNGEGDQPRPSRIASSAASRRPLTPSLTKIRATWVVTVRTLM